MLIERKLKDKPDISYDLDGDGIVGGRDLVVAKAFDKDKDGKLDWNEREEALRSIVVDRFEDRYMWGIEQSAG